MRGVSRLGRSARSAAACASLLALMTPATMIANPSSHKGAVAPVATNHHDTTVPANYDIRWELAEARAGKLAVDPARAAAAERLAAKVPGLTIHADEASGLPKMITTLVPGQRLSGSLAAKASGDPASAARSFLSANAALYGLSANDLATARLQAQRQVKVQRLVINRIVQPGLNFGGFECSLAGNSGGEFGTSQQDFAGRLRRRHGSGLRGRAGRRRRLSR